tara:strand:- start:7 stop:336 length:330 start_codon:yes stop_codon:yes gene_type:complete
MCRFHISFKTILFYICVTSLVSAQGQLPNSVLQLDGEGDHIELPGAVFIEAEEATVEGWFKWDDLAFYSQVFSLGDKRFEMGMNHRDTSPTLRATASANCTGGVTARCG